MVHEAEAPGADEKSWRECSSSAFQKRAEGSAERKSGCPKAEADDREAQTRAQLKTESERKRALKEAAEAAMRRMKEKNSVLSEALERVVRGREQQQLTQKVGGLHQAISWVEEDTKAIEQRCERPDGNGVESSESGSKRSNEEAGVEKRRTEVNDPMQGP